MYNLYSPFGNLCFTEYDGYRLTPVGIHYSQCVCVCVCTRVHEKERERERDKENT